MRVAPVTFLFFASLVPTSVHAIEVDGRIDAEEWASARHIVDFAKVQPLTRNAASHRTEAWILSTPQGLAVAFRNTQPSDVPRTRQRIRRDEPSTLDRVNVAVDFQGDGRTANNFMVSVNGDINDAVITNEHQYNLDWDGDWQRAVSEDDDAWSVEILIPWHVAPMPRSTDGKRTINVYLDRVVGSTGERVAWPHIISTLPRFVSDFSRVEVENHEQSLLAVTPYASATYDNVRSTSTQRVGADLFWKVNGQFQLAATLNPDFGHVESDDLVVNFSAIETFFRDKRPFFTENQGMFDVPFGTGGSRLLYTRRIGARADDGSGLGDVRAAVKLNGSLGKTSYGVLVATEADAVGRDFLALRGTHDFGQVNLGGLVTRVERPFQDRTATVYAVDSQWTPTERVDVTSTLVASQIDQAGQQTRDTGIHLRANHQLDGGWRQQVSFVQSGRGLQLNDIGFLDRNDLLFLRYELARRISDLPADSRYASHDWRGAVVHRTNNHGLYHTDILVGSITSSDREGGYRYLESSVWADGNDDMILRGNGVVKVPEKFYFFYDRLLPRRGRLDWNFIAQAAAEGLEGIEGIGGQVVVRPTLHVSDALNFSLGLRYQLTPDWLLWRGGTRLGSFDAKTAAISGGAQWRVSERQELRMKLEAIALDADLKQAWRVGADRRPVPSSDQIPSFTLRNLGFQVRYRYEIAPLSDLYLVYGRGGLSIDDESRSLADLLGDTFSLRNDEQFLIKLSYRFAN